MSQRPVIREKGGGEQGRGRTRHICVRSDVGRVGTGKSRDSKNPEAKTTGVQLDVEAGTVETLSARTYSNVEEPTIVLYNTQGVAGPDLK